jgi:hypothetical protein
MTTRALSRRSLIATGLAAGTAATFASAFAQQQMTAEKMRALIDYTIRRNKENNKTPTVFSKTVTPILFDRTDEVLLLQIGNDEGALKESFSVTVNLSEQHVVVFSRTEDAIYFHLTGAHLRRQRSAANRRQGGASLWTAPEAATDFARQMTYWAGRSTT